MKPYLTTSTQAGAGVSELAELRNQLGRELSLPAFHTLLHRAAHGLGRDALFGTCLITCSDEFQGDLRRSFDQDVAQPLLSASFGEAQRSFEISNLGARVEPGTMALFADHFVQPEHAGAELFVAHISAHLGRRRDGETFEYGYSQRFGTRSPCCGALNAALQTPAKFEPMRLTWLDQLRDSFGGRRLEELRELPVGVRPIQHAVTHAVLQAEAALTDLWRDPPDAGQTILLVSSVSVNQPGEDGLLPVAYHLLRVDGKTVRVVEGNSLPAGPADQEVDLTGDLLTVTRNHRTATRCAALTQLPGPHSPAPSPELAACVQQVREVVVELGQDPTAWRVYVRPLLRGMFQALALVDPRHGVTALRAEPSVEWALPEELEALESGDDASLCNVLRATETRVQQLRYEDAQRILDRLVAADTPLFGA